MTTSSGDLTWRSILSELLAGRDLGRDAASWAMDEVMSARASDVEVAGFLVALRAKGESVAEVRALADVMVEHSVPLPLRREGRRVVDIVGTGGDGFDTVNISTMACVISAAAGVTVVKHGNRAASSKSGAADVLEALGVDLALEPADVGRVAEEAGITFCFAQTFHPSMRFAAPARRGLGVPTAFNILGPITNPARPEVSVVGCAQESAMDLLAGVFADRGTSAVVMRGREGLDEASTAGPTDVRWVRDGVVTQFVLEPAVVGVRHHATEELRGGDAAHNAEIAHQVLGGADLPATEAAVLNAGLALAAASPVDGALDQAGFDALVADSVRAARAAIADGSTQRVLADWVRASRGTTYPA
ncbi:anthranilate phosphoribosyltransferase [Kytococcus sedentarius]|uniref:anthranilate phosphoribosyltransferase n=1 Tax=Kytococcus sedentarius TaxID=1276 RepID=UPI00384EA5A1